MQRSDRGQGEDPLCAITAAILAHPSFDEAACTYMARLIEWRRRLGLFNRIGTGVLFHIINYVIYLHYSARAGVIEHGATYSRLLAICEARGNCGPRALRTGLAVLQAFGRLHSERAADDGRVQIYVPADAMLRDVREFYGYSLTLLDSLLKDTSYGAAIHDDADFIARHMSRIGRAIIEDGVRITEHFPDLHEIIHQAGGLPTSISLAYAQVRAAPFPMPKVLAREFSVSASQVRAVIGGLSDRKLVVRSDDGRIVDAALLLEQHKGLVAREIALHVRFGLVLDGRFPNVGP